MWLSSVDWDDIDKSNKRMPTTKYSAVRNCYIILTACLSQNSWKYEKKIVIVVHVFQKTLNLVSLRCYFAEDSQEKWQNKSRLPWHLSVKLGSHCYRGRARNIWAIYKFALVQRGCLLVRLSAVRFLIDWLIDVLLSPNLQLWVWSAIFVPRLRHGPIVKRIV